MKNAMEKYDAPQLKRIGNIKELTFFDPGAQVSCFVYNEVTGAYAPCSN